MEPLRFPLHGSRLIEASAGTGKTFTIALLYVRLILGHGDIGGFGRALTPRDILVVTFTEAATKELRDRIRKRLAQAADVFRADPQSGRGFPSGSDLLQDLRNEYPPEQWPGRSRLLQLAAESMDEAAVHTIHGWCNRMLKEHAFDSGGLFNQSLETDDGQLLGEVTRDYWRTFVTELDCDEAEAYLASVRSPADLQGRVRSLLKLHEALPPAQGSPRELLSARIAERREVFDSVRGQLADQATDFMGIFLEAKAGKQVNGSKIRQDRLKDWLDRLTLWCQTTDMAPPDLTDAAWHRLSCEGLEEAWKGAQAPTDHPLIHSMARVEAQRALSVPAELFWLHATHWIAGRLEKEKNRRGEMGFDDLLTRLDGALRQDESGRLARTIRAQFPVAMIDEFQDTDPVQYRIFDAVYGIADNNSELGIFMIGDPKQAIYKFRGADIHTYLKARAATDGRHVTLPRNFRSSADQVAASNRVFSFAETRQRQGAFLFRSETDADGKDNPLPFVEVSAQGRPEGLVIEGASYPAITFWSHQNTDNKGDVEQRVANACASEIARLLTLGIQQKAGFSAARGSHGDSQTSGGRFAPLRSSDIAILVNKGSEAHLIRTALSERGVKSVYLSDRASVLNTPAARDILRWLEACAEPERDRLVRAALATATLDLPWSRLDELRRNELDWELEIERFRLLRVVWREQGVLAMVRRILTAFEVPSRLLKAGNGERILTDVLHIAELLQSESQEVDGEQALIRRLADMIAETRGEAEALQVRLESDADLVQVVTVHKSKGLEYPLVFLPFGSSCRPTAKKDSPLTWHDDNGKLQMSFECNDLNLALADRERLGEDIRKLYVAMTRARYATWVGAAEMKGEELRGALGYLAGAGPDTSLHEGLEAMVGDEPAMALEGLPVITGERYQPPEPPELTPALRPVRAARVHWWIASYSAIQYHLVDLERDLPRPPSSIPEPETAAAERQLEETDRPREVHARPVRHPNPAGRRIHGFYRGAEPGTFLHGLLEWCAEPAFSTVSAREQELADMLLQRCAVRGWEAWAQPLANWLADMIATPLQLPRQPDGSEARVALEALKQSVPEMEFWFATDQVQTAELDRLVRNHTLLAAPETVRSGRPEADPLLLNGMLKGFIDLVFEHGGRYYVADYKSNYIGPDDAAYTTEAMAGVVADKRYDLQYALYLLALHRLLKARLVDYDYDRHIGGAVYIFLRGNHSPGGGVHCDRPDRALIEALDRLFRGKPASQSSSNLTEADQ
nr:exodeoxyribonuclease V subunit beta [Marinobacter salicampi]